MAYPFYCNSWDEERNRPGNAPTIPLTTIPHDVLPFHIGPQRPYAAARCGDLGKVRIIWRLINESIWGIGEAALFPPPVPPCQRGREGEGPLLPHRGLLHPHLRVGSTCCQMGLTPIERGSDGGRGNGLPSEGPSSDPRRCNACTPSPLSLSSTRCVYLSRRPILPRFRNGCAPLSCTGALVLP